MSSGRGKGGGRQLPLALGHATGQSRDDLVVTPANRVAVELVDGWPEWPSSAALLVGPAGSGKTHLAAVWRERAGALALPADGLRALAAADLRQPVLVEDLDSAPVEELGLFHLLNAVRAARQSVLMTARRPPSGWGVRLPDLQSRLRAASLAAMEAPDDALLAGVIVKLFADRQVEIDPAVVEFMLRRMERSLKAAARAVERLDRAALERKSRITRALAAEVLETAGSDAPE